MEQQSLKNTDTTNIKSIIQKLEKANVDLANQVTVSSAVWTGLKHRLDLLNAPDGQSAATNHRKHSARTFHYQILQSGGPDLFIQTVREIPLGTSVATYKALVLALCDWWKPTTVPSQLREHLRVIYASELVTSFVTQLRDQQMLVGGGQIPHASTWPLTLAELEALLKCVEGGEEEGEQTLLVYPHNGTLPYIQLTGAAVTRLAEVYGKTTS